MHQNSDASYFVFDSIFLCTGIHKYNLNYQSFCF